MTGKTYSDGTPSASYTYDTDPYGYHTNAIGRLTSVCYSSPDCEGFGYDPMGRLLRHERNVNGTWRNVLHSYNLAGAMTELTYPGGRRVGYTYNTAGRVTQVKEANGALQVYADSISYHPHGAWESMTLSNGALRQSVSYNNRLQPTEMRAYDPATQADTLKLTYGFADGNGNNNGNVISWSAVGAQSFSRTFTYDELNRLKTMSGTGGSCTGLDWTYDIWGNRTDQTVTGGTCTQNQLTINTKNQITNAGFTYDASGNMTADGSNTYQYDAENRMVSVDSGATATYVYDASGQRVQKTVGTAQTHYIYGLAGGVVAEVNESGVWTVGYVYLNGQLLAQYSNATTYFAHPDHLGSTRVLTRVSATVFQSYDYLPFGEELSGGSGTSHKFTGQERDSESGLDYFGARYYASSLGRFSSPDLPFIDQHTGNPQSWNLYSYVRNNPLVYIDPSGRSRRGGGLMDKQEGKLPGVTMGTPMPLPPGTVPNQYPLVAVNSEDNTTTSDDVEDAAGADVQDSQDDTGQEGNTAAGERDKDAEGTNAEKSKRGITPKIDKEEAEGIRKLAEVFAKLTHPLKLTAANLAIFGTGAGTVAAPIIGFGPVCGYGGPFACAVYALPALGVSASVTCSPKIGPA